MYQNHITLVTPTEDHTQVLLVYWHSSALCLSADTEQEHTDNPTTKGGEGQISVLPAACFCLTQAESKHI